MVSARVKLNERLRELRKSHGYTVRQLAELIDRTPGYVSRIEGRGEIPSPQLLCILADIYSVGVEDLFLLAKQGRLARAAEEIDTRQADALTQFRKGKHE